MTDELTPRRIERELSRMDGVTVKQEGEWILVRGNSFPWRKSLGSLGFRWSYRKRCWYIRDGLMPSRKFAAWIESKKLELKGEN